MSTGTDETAKASVVPRAASLGPSAFLQPLSPLRALQVLSIIGPLLILVLVAWDDYRSTISHAEQSALQNARVLQEHAQKVFETHELALVLLEERIRGMTWDEIGQSEDLHKFLAALDNRFEQIGSMWTIGPTGRNWNGSQFFPVPDADVSEREYFKAIRSGERLHISEPYSNRWTGAPVVGVAMRRSSPSGNFDGLLLSTVYIQYFQDFYRAVDQNHQRTISLTRADGVQLVRNPPLGKPVVFTPDSGLMKAIAQSEEGIFTTVAQADGVERIYAFRRLKDYPVFVTFGVSRQDLLAPWRTHVLVYGMMAAIAAASLLGLTTILYRRLEAQSDARRAEILESIADAFFAVDADWRFSYANRRALQTWGKADRDVIGERVLDVFPQARDSTSLRALQRVMETRRPEHVETISPVLKSWLSINIYPTPGGGLSVYFRDVTARKQAEHRQNLLINELNHRVKNTLATVQSIAMQTARTTEPPAQFAKVFGNRLRALASAHDILTERSWEGALMGDIASKILEPFGAGDRITIQGPAIMLAPVTAVNFCMALHELATNAAKYGALSSPEGRISLTWTVDAAAVAVTWREMGGPPVHPPTRKGFGLRVLDQGLKSEGGEIMLAFEPDGLRCDIRLPLSVNVAKA